MYALIAEKDMSAAKVMQDLLADCYEVEVTIAPTIELVECVLRCNRYDLVFLNLTLANASNGNGCTLLARLKPLAQGASIIVVGDYLDGDHVTTCLNNGAAAALPKGAYSGDTFKRVCKSVIANRNAEEKFRNMREQIKEVKGEIAMMKPAAY